MYPPYICEECKQPCTGSNTDLGIGPTEFWGSVANDVLIKYVSDCCEATMFEDVEINEDGDKILYNEVHASPYYGDHVP